MTDEAARMEAVIMGLVNEARAATEERRSLQ